MLPILSLVFFAASHLAFQFLFKTWFEIEFALAGFLKCARLVDLALKTAQRFIKRLIVPDDCFWHVHTSLRKFLCVNELFGDDFDTG